MNFLKNIETKTSGLIWVIPAFLCCIFSGGHYNSLVMSWFFPLFCLRVSIYNNKFKIRRLILIFLLIYVASLIKFQGIITGASFIDNCYILSLVGIVYSIPFIFTTCIWHKVRNSLVRVLLLPITWTCVDVIVVLSGMGTIVSLGCSQVEFTLFIQICSLFGFSSIVFIMTLFASIVCDIWNNNFNIKTKSYLKKEFYSLVLIFVFVLGFGSIRLAFNPLSNNTMRVASVTNFYSVSSFSGVNKDEYFSDFHFIEILKNMEKDIENAKHAYASCVMWQEECFPIMKQNETKWEECVIEMAKKYDITLFVPMEIRNVNAKSVNKLICVNNVGDICYSYLKSNLVPFVETSEYEQGDGIIHSTKIENSNVASVICYDSSNFLFINHSCPIGTDILLSPSWEWEQISNYSGYGNILRSVENGFSYVRNSFKGLVVAADPYARILTNYQSLNNNSEIIYSDVPIKGCPTIYKQFGWIVDIVVLIVYYAYCVYCLIIAHRKKQ